LYRRGKTEEDGMKKIKGKQERTPKEGNRLGNVHVALQFLFVHAILFHCPENGKREQWA